MTLKTEKYTLGYMRTLPAFALLALCALPSAAAQIMQAEVAGVGGFPAGTMITATSGDIAIEDIRPGDRILAFSDEKLVQSFVQDSNSRRTLLLTIVTDRGRLITARTHKLLTWNGFVEAQNLKEDDGLAILKDGRRKWAKVRSVKNGKLSRVHNLVTGPPHTFIANGYMVHNEGGERLPAPAYVWIFFGLAALAAAALTGRHRREAGEEF
jgi:hypothetical protein